MAGGARIWLIVVATLAIGAAALAAVAITLRDGEGVIPDRIQPGDQAGPAQPAAHCPAGVPGCSEVSGRIVYVEAVDPDGDGDAHFVLADLSSVTGPGITVVDVRRKLRPQPLPGPGDHLSAAGPLASGSYGQHQVEAVRLGG